MLLDVNSYLGRILQAKDPYTTRHFDMLTLEHRPKHIRYFPV
jgi:hypothetical protein